jgi:hypothetical protein
VTSNTCTGGTHQFLIGRDFGKSCLCGAMMMDKSGKVVPRVTELEQLMTEVWDANVPRDA